MRTRLLAVAAATAILGLSGARTQASLTDVYATPHAGEKTLYSGAIGYGGSVADTIMGHYYGAPANYVRVDDSLDEIWTYLTAGGTADIVLQAKYAAASNYLGVIPDNSPPAGVDPNSAYASLARVDGGGYAVTFGDVQTDNAEVVNAYTIRIYGSNLTPPPDPLSDPFAWAIGSKTVMSYASIAARNPLNFDAMVAFKVGDKYVVAFEDAGSGGDKDYNDMVFELEGVAPVPEPTTLLGAGLALLGTLGVARLRRRGA